MTIDMHHGLVLKIKGRLFFRFIGDLKDVFILLFGLGVVFRSVSLFFIFTPLFICFNVCELKSIEEPEMSRRLGHEYLKYKARTPMFIPALRVKFKDKK